MADERDDALLKLDAVQATLYWVEKDLKARMSAEECIHGLEPIWCFTCKHGPAPAHDRPTVEATFRAKFEGDCSGCDLPVYVGQSIHRLSTGRYVHEGCE